MSGGLEEGGERLSARLQPRDVNSTPSFTSSRLRFEEEGCTAHYCTYTFPFVHHFSFSLGTLANGELKLGQNTAFAFLCFC